MKELVEYIVRSLVENKDAVSVSIEENDEETVVKVSVADEDMGRVIGKSGRVASSIRTIVKSLAGKDKRKTFVKFGE